MWDHDSWQMVDAAIMFVSAFCFIMAENNWKHYGICHLFEAILFTMYRSLKSN